MHPTNVDVAALSIAILAMGSAFNDMRNQVEIHGSERIAWGLRILRLLLVLCARLGLAQVLLRVVVTSPFA